MAEANKSLSSKRALERMRRHRHAVNVHAVYSAKKSVLAQLRAQGLRVAHFSARDISVLANAEFERNRTQLLAEAEVAIAAWPGFARWRCAELSIKAQTNRRCAHKQISVQMSGGE